MNDLLLSVAPFFSSFAWTAEGNTNLPKLSTEEKAFLKKPLLRRKKVTRFLSETPKKGFISEATGL